MAEKVVGLRIELNGFNGVVTSIKQLEDELRKAKEDLNELEIGSDNFRILQGEISKTETKLIGLRKASEGIGLEKQLEGYGKLAAGITSSFAAATAAVQLFGGDSEEVSKAAAQAQNIVTIALSARGVEEILLGARITARTIAEKAATAAIETEIGALRVLYTTIAANPIGAIVAAIGLLTAAVIAFADSEEKVVDTTKELGKVTSDEAEKWKIYSSVLLNANSTFKQRTEAVKELKKIQPGFNALIDEENRLTKEGKDFIDAKIQSLILEAQTRLIVQKIAENNNKLLEINNRTVDESITGFQKLKNAILGNATSYALVGSQTLNATDAIKNNKEETDKLTKSNEQWNAELLKAFNKAGDIDKILTPINGKLEKQAKAEKDLANNTNDANKATDAQIAAQKALEAQLTSTEKLYASTLEKIKKLVEVANVDTPSPKIIKDLEAIVNARKSLVPDDLTDVFEKLGFTIEMVGGKIVGLEQIGKKSLSELAKDSTELGVKLGDNVFKLQDEFGKFYDLARNYFGDKVIKQSVEEFSTTVDEQITAASKLFQENKITKEAFDAFIKITEQYKNFNKLVKEGEGIEKVFSVEVLEKFLKTQREIGIATGIIKYDYDDLTGVITEVDKKSVDYVQTLKNQKTQVADLTTDLINYYKSQFDFQSKTFKATLDTSKLTKDQLKDLSDLKNKSDAEIFETIKKIAEAQANGLVKLSETIVQEETQIRDFLKQSQDLRLQGFALEADALKGALLNNLELVFQATQKENEIRIDAKAKQNEQIVSLENDLKNKGIDISKLTEEEKLKILKFYLDKQVKATQDAEKEKKDKIKTTVEALQTSLQIISKGLSDLASLTAQSFQLQLDRLQTSYESTLGQIVGDTEQANAKRLELEKEYQAEKRQIEKEAQLTALKFTLAQAIASSAQAIISALATLGPVFGPISAAITAGITAAQIAIISQQISQVQNSKRRGGLLQGGGLVEGPSHEQGGVYAGGGFVLEGNEAVINRQSTLKYAGLLSQINESGGGRPITVQAPMDSRLVEALAKQSSEPIRAYVVESDISKAQAINKRLEQLASF